MAAINFPDSPSDGDTHVVGGVTYTYNNAETKWKTTINSNAFLPLSGGTLSGNLTLGSNQLTAGGLTYPTSDGTNGQYLQTNGSGTLSFSTVATPTVAFENYAILEDQKTQNTNGGTFSTGAWRTRDLNTEVADPDSIVTIATNQFTLAAGTYFISWSAPAFNSGSHQSALFDSTNTAYYYGSSAYSADASNVQSRSFGSVRITITGSTVFEIRHRTDNGNSNNGFGVCSNFATEVYTRVEILKEA